jgi:hypothetical protein
METHASSVGYSGAKGSVGILNVGAGDTKLSFDKSNPAERIRAARIVKDMLRRGYALLIEVDVGGEKKFTRAIDFDEDVCEYVIADFDPIEAAKHEEQEDGDVHQESEGKTVGATETEPTQPRPKRGGKRRVEAESTRAVAVGRTAGG